MDSENVIELSEQEYEALIRSNQELRAENEQLRKEIANISEEINKTKAVIAGISETVDCMKDNLEDNGIFGEEEEDDEEE